MRTTIRAAAIAAAALFLATAAAAQDTPSISLTSSDRTHWDVAAHAAWFGSNHSDIGTQWDRWYSTPAGGLAIGRYWTPHFKVEIQGTVSGTGRIYSQEQVAVPGQPFPRYVSRDHVFQATTVHAGAAYQFFENQWFHPFIGGGLEVVREGRRVDVLQQITSGRDPSVPPQVIPGSRGSQETSYLARPFVDAGFKWFVTERAFIRSDLTTSMSGRGFAQTAWSTGVGVEF